MRTNGRDGKIGMMKADQQLVLLLPARWWLYTLPEFGSGGWWQRPHK